MYSPLYEYFEIRSNKDYSEQKSVEEITKVLEETNVLTKTGDHSFINKDNFPWIDIKCVYSVDGKYGSDEKLKNANLIVIVTSKNKEQKQYLEILKEISLKLGWELILEEDEDGNENVLIA